MVIEAVANFRQVLHTRLLAAREETDALFRIVRPEALYDRPIPERHRIVFYIGHLEAFDWNLLRGSHASSEFDRLFAFGIDPLGGNLPTDVPQDWPALQTVYEYRDRTRRQIDSLLAETVFQDDDDAAFREKLHVAIEHRLMHAETLAYIFHQLPFNRKHGSPAPRVLSGYSFQPAYIRVPAGIATLGLRRDSQVFGWDNEFGQYNVDVPEFEIDKYKVTNGQYLRFLEEGGYADRSLWKPADWEWRSRHDVLHPVFWNRRSGGWSLRSMFDEIPLPLDWPVYVSHAEATAYARWAGKILPTEAQWHRAASGVQLNREHECTWDPAPVHECAQGQSEFGVEGLVGNGWEWTSTEFAPFPGFHAMPFYPGYSEPFFDGKHYVLKGGSTRTASVMLRSSFRNWFQPHYQYIYAGFRCAAKGDDSI
jgi:iron(II)-dependent oxidoreductase